MDTIFILSSEDSESDELEEEESDANLLGI
jgi:hypothetical protein